MKKKYYFIGFVVLLVAILGYHFYAAAEAEEQIDKTIQEQTAKSESVSAQYSSVDVSPFSGNVSIKDLTFAFGGHIERAKSIHLDIGYLDFLNIYFGGVTYGLDNLGQAKVSFIQPSYVNKSSLQEIQMDTLHILYRGNLLDGLRSAVNQSAFSSAHSIEAKSTGLTFQFPNSTLSRLTADSMSYSGTIEEGKTNFWKNGSHQISLNSLIWTPSESFQNTYRFFIQGFGYQADAIPFRSARLSSEPGSQSNALQIDSQLKSELALLSAEGFINLEKPFGSSELRSMKLSLTHFSDSFNQTLQSFERLLSISLPRDSNAVVLKVTGTLANPKVSMKAKQ